MTVEFTAQNAPLELDLGEPAAKPTATTPGVVEAAKSIWEADGVDLGFWECSPGSFTATREGYSEICQILSGSVTITTDGGESVRLEAGDTIVMPSGWRGTWDVHETVRKTYVIIND